MGNGIEQLQQSFMNEIQISDERTRSPGDKIQTIDEIFQKQRAERQHAGYPEYIGEKDSGKTEGKNSEYSHLSHSNLEHSYEYKNKSSPGQNKNSESVNISLSLENDKKLDKKPEYRPPKDKKTDNDKNTKKDTGINSHDSPEKHITPEVCDPPDKDQKTEVIGLCHISYGATITGSFSSLGAIDIAGRVVGDLKSESNISVTGEVQGDIQASNITISGDKAHVVGNLCGIEKISIQEGSILVGDIVSSSVEIAGAVRGNIEVSEDVVLKETAIVCGDVKAKAINIAKGAVIKGNCTLNFSDEQFNDFSEVSDIVKNKFDNLTLEEKKSKTASL